MVDIANTVDFSKKGTVILSHYRSGSHYLQSAIALYARKNVDVMVLGEQNSLDWLTLQADAYCIVILNDPRVKAKLAAQTRMVLNEFHVIKLEHRDIVRHFISTLSWWNNNREYKYHHDSEQTFTQAMVEYDINLVDRWKLELSVLQKLKSHVQLDYSELQSLSTPTLNWAPNTYNFTLSDMFTNADEIEKALTTSRK
jgi:hypothetical protein